MHLSEMQAIKFEIAGIVNSRYAMALTITEYLNGNWYGNLVIFANMADNSIIAAFVSHLPEFKFKMLPRHARLLGETSSKIEYIFPVDWRNANTVGAIKPEVIRYKYNAGAFTIASNHFTSNTVGMTACYFDFDLQLFATAANEANNYLKASNPSVYVFSRVGVVQNYITTIQSDALTLVSVVIETFAVQQGPDKLKVAYGFGQIYNKGLTTYFPRSSLPTFEQDRIFVIEILISEPSSSDCLRLNPFVISVAHSGQDLPLYYIELMHSQHLISKMLLTFMVTPSAASNHIGELGSKIVRMEVPAHFKCNSLTTSTATSNSQAFILRGSSQEQAFTGSDDFSSQMTIPLKSHFYGAMCATIFPPSPCRISDFTTFLGWDSGNKFLYLATSISKFVFDNGTADDGFKVHPTILDGQASLTNGGSKSILIGGNAKFGMPLTSVANPNKMFFISFQRMINLLKISGASTTGQGFTSVNQDLKIEAYSQANYPPDLQGNSFMGISPVETNSAGISATTAKDYMLNLDSWHAAAGVKCSLVDYNDANTPKMCSITRFVMTNSLNNDENVGIFNPILNAVQFELNVDLAAIKSVTSSLSFYQLAVRHILATSNFGTRKTYFNSGVAWLMPDLTDQIPFDSTQQTSLAARSNVLYKYSGGRTSWKYRVSAQDLATIRIPASHSASRLCTAVDQFSLRRQSMSIDYDGANKMYSNTQDYFVSNSHWQNTVQKINIGVMVGNQFQGLNTFDQAVIQIQLPALPSFINNIGIAKFIVMQKECADLFAPSVTSPPLMKTLDASVLSANPLQYQEISVSLNYSDCSASPLVPKQEYMHFNLQWDEVATATLIEDMLTQFSSHAVDSKCVIKEWFVSEIGSSARMDNLKQEAVLTYQYQRQNQLGPLVFNCSLMSGPHSQTYQFQINVLMRGTAMQPIMSALNPFSIKINVTLGCFKLDFLNISISSTNQSQIKSFDNQSGKLVWVLPQSNISITTSLNLTGIVKFNTNHPVCGAFKLTSFSDMQFKQQTTSLQSGLINNPTFASQTDSTIQVYISLIYGGTAHPLPPRVYLRAETNNLKEPAKVRDWSIEFEGCPEPRVRQFVSQEIKLLGKTETIELMSLFELDESPFGFCQVRQFDLIKTNEDAQFLNSLVYIEGSQLIISGSLLQTQEFRVRMFSVSPKYASLNFRATAIQALEDLIVIVEYPGNFSELNQVNKIKHQIPCCCLSVSYMADLIRLLLDHSNLTTNDVGSHLVQAFIGDSLLYEIRLSIYFNKQTFKAEGVLSNLLTSYETVWNMSNVIITPNSSSFSNNSNQDSQSRHDYYFNRTAEQISWKEYSTSITAQTIALLIPEIKSSSILVMPSFNPWLFKLNDQIAKRVFEEYLPNNKPPQLPPISIPKPVILRVADVDRNGVFKIQFNQPLKIPSFLETQANVEGLEIGRKMVDLQEIDVHRDVMELVFVLNSEEEAEQIEYFLELRSWDENSIKVHINITQPLLVSKGPNPDQIFAKIKNTHMFTAKNSNERLSANRIYLHFDLPSLLPNGISNQEVLEQVVIIESGITTMYFLQFGIQLLLKGSMDLLWNLFFSLQIVCYLVIYDIPMPANIGLFTDEFTKIIEFQMINVNNIVGIFTGNPDFDLMTEINEEDSGDSMLIGLSAYLILALLLIIAMCCLCFILVCIKRCRNKIKKMVTKIVSRFLFNGLIRSITIAYIQVCKNSGEQIGNMMNEKNKLQKSEQKLAVVMFLVMFGYPFISIATTAYYRNQLNTYKFRLRIANFYSNIDLTKGNQALAYYTIFLVRRILFVAIPTFLVGKPWYQVQTLLLLTSVYIIYYASTQPHALIQRNRLEIFNEAMIMLMNYHMVCFSEFNLNPFSQFLMGYSFVGCILFLIAGNLGLLIMNQYRMFMLRRAHKQVLKGMQERLKALRQTNMSANEIKEAVIHYMHTRDSKMDGQGEDIETRTSLIKPLDTQGGIRKTIKQQILRSKTMISANDQNKDFVNEFRRRHANVTQASRISLPHSVIHEEPEQEDVQDSQPSTNSRPRDKKRKKHKSIRKDQRRSHRSRQKYK